MSDVSLDKKAYKKLIEDDIKLIEQYVPKNHILKEHIIMVLNWSVDKQYPPKIWDKKENLPDDVVRNDMGILCIDPRIIPDIED